ncbi:alpha-L-arabinofuranosidase B [Streptomyces sp. NPDC102406]|uniref:alpha-L-arabinofuranosidase B n=1 Tax=Streptomyces sp. NPDC102406 TaxID=3366171 RepID=UPI0038290BD2
MSVTSARTRRTRPLALLALVLAMAAAMLGVQTSTGVSAAAAGARPCDLYAAGGTPCVAAHSSTRALYSAYNSRLYQVKRASDGATRDIGVLGAGGYADAAAQDSFCAGTSCLITVLYDQSGRGNHLTQAPPGGFQGPAAGGYDNLAEASAAPVTVGGHKAYGVFVAPGTGYRNNRTNGIATGDQPEGMYAILDGSHRNGGCCFDYGNAETNSLDNGNGTMETIYFGDSKAWGYGTGNGPWVMADLENGLFSGVNRGYNANSPSISHRFLTAVVKGESNHWAIRAGNAQSGGLATHYDGPRPNASGYHPMKKEGAIILGIGGDNSNSSAGTFYEGVMTSGYPSNATENAVQADINAAGYATYAVPGTPAVGSRVSLRATTACCTNTYLRHNSADSNAALAAVSSSSTSADKAAATWTVRAGLGDASCVSFESADKPGQYLRHYDFRLRVDSIDSGALSRLDATFCPQAGHNGQGVSLRSANYPSDFVRHYDYGVYAASHGGSHAWDAATAWADDTSWVVTSPWA